MTINTTTGRFMTDFGHIMLDLETMGKGSSAAIIAIGAVEFDPTTNTLGREFYRTIDLENSVENGGIMDPSTVLWWMRQSEAAREEFAREGQPLRTVLHEFYEFVNESAGHCFELGIWGNGAAFDNVILRNAYANTRLKCPWEFRQDRCYRTLKALHPAITAPRGGTNHHALDDAKNQALHLMEILSRPNREVEPPPSGGRV
jgi:exodeoxyribonuclease VIII